MVELHNGEDPHWVVNTTFGVMFAFRGLTFGVLVDIAPKLDVSHLPKFSITVPSQGGDVSMIAIAPGPGGECSLVAPTVMPHNSG